MKKFFFAFLFLMAGCSNIDKKEYYYNNSVKMNVIFDQGIDSFKDGYLKIYLNSKNNTNLIEERYIYDISHEKDDTHNKKILVNFNKLNYKETNVQIELYADTNLDNILECYKARLKENKSNINERYLVFEIRDDNGICVNYRGN